MTETYKLEFQANQTIAFADENVDPSNGSWYVDFMIIGGVPVISSFSDTLKNNPDMVAPNWVVADINEELVEVAWSYSDEDEGEIELSIGGELLIEVPSNSGFNPTAGKIAMIKITFREDGDSPERETKIVSRGTAELISASKGRLDDDGDWVEE